MLPYSLSKYAVLHNVALYLGRRNTNQFFDLFTHNGDPEAIAVLKLDLIFRICHQGDYGN